MSGRKATGGITQYSISSAARHIFVRKLMRLSVARDHVSSVSRSAMGTIVYRCGATVFGLRGQFLGKALAAVARTGT